MKRTAVIAPYAEIVLETPDGEILYFPRTTRRMPKPPKEAKPHPHGVDIEQLKSIIRSTRAKTLKDLLVTEFQSIGEKTAVDFLERYGIDPKLKPRELLRKGRERLLRRLVDALMEYPFRSPKSDYLSPIGSDIIEIGLRRMFAPEWVGAGTRSPKAHRGHPFIVEVGIAYGGSIESRDEPLLLRYANKIPLLYEEREDVSYKVVSSINWKQYNIDFPAPLVVLVHIASTKVPYKGVGKESVSDVPEIESEIRNAVQEIARKLRIYLSRKAREQEAIKRSITLAKYIPEVALSLAYFIRPPEKWQPPREEEVRKIKESLIRLVARNIDLPPIDGESQDPEEIVRKIVESVQLD